MSDKRSRPQPEHLLLLPSPDWTEYELLDSGHGAKLERYGPHRIVRPEPQAMWRPALPHAEWDKANLVFHGDEETGEKGWETRKAVDPRWPMHYKNLSFWVQPTPFRHMGVFPEQATQWDWIGDQIRAAKRQVNVLCLFGYTGIASLAAAAASASVTHLDASKKAVTWARDNQTLSGLQDKPVRWIVDDVRKFVQRESRRGARYDGIILDPPKFGRGPKGEIWRLEESLPNLFTEMKSLLSPKPLFVILTVYALRFSATSLHGIMSEFTHGINGAIESGETVLNEKSAGRLLSTAVFARWSGI